MWTEQGAKVASSRMWKSVIAFRHASSTPTSLSDQRIRIYGLDNTNRSALSSGLLHPSKRCRCDSALEYQWSDVIPPCGLAVSLSHEPLSTRPSDPISTPSLVPAYMHLISTRHDYYIDLLEDLTRGPRCEPTNLVICMSRIDFLRHLVLQVQHQSEAATEALTEPHSDDNGHKSHGHPFMTSALRLIAASRLINLVYCPTIPVLRAWLSTCTIEPGPSSADASQMIIVDAVALHHGTSEFTFQGLSRTLAATVSAAHITKSRLTLVECMDISDPSNPDRGNRLWDQQLPLLSGSVKLGLERSRWAGQSVTVRKIIARWFSFESSKGKVPRAEEDEMLI
jgi:hypothetical protein